MIFKKSAKPNSFQNITKNNQSISWKQKFRMNLYRKNYQFLETGNIDHVCYQDDTYNQAAMNLIANVRKQYKNYQQIQQQFTPKIDHLYCNIIPLKKSVEFDDEIVNTFVYLRKLKQKNKLVEQDSFYAEIRKFLKQSKQQNRIQEGWQICLKRFIINLDVLRRIQLFIEFQKKGSKFFQQIHQKYAKYSLIDVFIDSIMMSNRYFQKEVRLNKTWKISLQMNDKITEANISKTMKMLFCSICLIYDCGKHRLQDLSQHRNHHYSSLVNTIPKNIHTASAISLLKQLKQLQNGTKISKSHCCSQNCFRKLNKQSYEGLDLQKSRIFSPMVESIVKIGIQLFSYKPCLIVKLFPHYAPLHTRITCAIIFLYLIQQINLQALINYKINLSQTQFLKRQTSKQTINIVPKNFNKNSLAIKKKHFKNNTQEFKYQQVAICFHNYIGQQSFDQNCLNCTCRKRGFCLPQCQCSPNCPIMAKGCLCKSKQECQNIKCPCYKNKNQCIPGVCSNCFDLKNCGKKNMCKNDQLLRDQTKNIKIGISKISGAGFGAFAGQKIKKGSLISVYCGEIVDQQMESIRQTLKKGQSFYNFACSVGSIDARFMGNKTRFINHGNESEGNTNLVSLNMFSCGQEYIGLYALRDIEIGEELLFDYDGDGEIAKTYSGLYSFLQKNKRIQL